VSKDHGTVLEIARMEKQIEIENILLEAGAK